MVSRPLLDMRWTSQSITTFPLDPFYIALVVVLLLLVRGHSTIVVFFTMVFLIDMSSNPSNSPVVTLSNKRYPYCLLLVGSRNGFERDFTIELK